MARMHVEQERIPSGMAAVVSLQIHDRNFGSTPQRRKLPLYALQLLSFLSPMSLSSNANADIQLHGSCQTDMDPLLSVLDLPAALQAQVIRTLDSSSRLSLFRTCKGFRDLVLDSAPSSRLELRPLASKQEQMLNAFELVKQHGTAVAVLLQGWQPQQPWEALFSSARDEHAREMTQRSCNLLHQAHLTGGLSSVTRLEIHGVELAVLLMPVFNNSCPNLTAITLRDSQITWEGATADSFSTVFPKLQDLHLHNVTSPELDKECQHGLQQQVAQLTGLKSLHISQNNAVPCLDCMPLHGAIAVALTPTILGQLTHLALLWLRPECQWEFKQLMSLQSLQLQSDLSDELMQQLLTLPNLTSVSAEGVYIAESYRGCKCQWQHLGAGFISLQNFSRLPLHSNLNIQGGAHGLTLQIFEEDTREQIQKALDNITGSHWPGWKGAHVTLRCGHGSEHEDLLFQALPLCHGVGRFTLRDVTISKGNMLALRDFAALQQSGLVLDLSSRCTWDVADLSVLMQSLPVGSSLIVSHIDEATVVQLCCMAACSFALHVLDLQDLRGKSEKEVKAHNKDRVQEALVQGGCEGPILYDKCYVDGDMEICWDWVVIVNFSSNDNAESVARDHNSWAAALQAFDTSSW